MQIIKIARAGIVTILSLGVIVVAPAQEVTVTRDGQPLATIVVAADAPEHTQSSASKLVDYIQRISGATLPVANSMTNADTATLIWVGPHHELANRHADFQPDLSERESYVIQTAGQDLILVGRDSVNEGVQIEAGTHQAVAAFIEDKLNVRWLWPGELGTDLIPSPTLSFAPFKISYSPPLQLRLLNYTNFERSHGNLTDEVKANLEMIGGTLEIQKRKDTEAREWLNMHRADAPPTGSSINCLAGTLYNYRARHAYAEWFSRYGKKNPEWFALQPNGTRKPFPRPKDVKMCVSNPGVAKQWIRNATKFFSERPNATTYEAGENDRGWEGYCVCEDCVAMDNIHAVMLDRDLIWENERRPSYALTDRYVRYWNQLAVMLKEQFPDRDIYVSTLAYHVTQPAPTIPLEQNILPAFVGIERRFYHRNNQEHTEAQREMWKGWWEAAGQRRALIWRPNIIYKTVGLPYIFTSRHAANMRFLYEHGLLGIYFGEGGGHWAIQGPQHYLHAKLAWNPQADAESVMTDYYQRGFGPASEFIQKYFEGFEKLYARLAEQYQELGYSTYEDPPRLFREMNTTSRTSTKRLGQEGVRRNQRVENQANELLNQAEAAVKNSEAKYRDRVAFIRLGFEFIKAQLDCIEAMNDLSASPSEANYQRAVDSANRRLEVLKQSADSFAVNPIDILREIASQQRYLGPPANQNPPENGPDAEKEQQKLIEDLEA